MLQKLGGPVSALHGAQAAQASRTAARTARGPQRGGMPGFHTPLTRRAALVQRYILGRPHPPMSGRSVASADMSLAGNRLQPPPVPPAPPEPPALPPADMPMEALEEYYAGLRSTLTAAGVPLPPQGDVYAEEKGPVGAPPPAAPGEDGGETDSLMGTRARVVAASCRVTATVCRVDMHVLLACLWSAGALAASVTRTALITAPSFCNRRFPPRRHACGGAGRVPEELEEPGGAGGPRQDGAHRPTVTIGAVGICTASPAGQGRVTRHQQCEGREYVDGVTNASRRGHPFQRTGR